MKIKNLNVREGNFSSKKRYKLERKMIATGVLLAGILTGTFVGTQLKADAKDYSILPAIIEEENDYNPAILTPTFQNCEILDEKGAEILFVEGENNFRGYMTVSQTGQLSGQHMYLSEGEYTVFVRYNGDTTTKKFQVEDGEQIQFNVDFSSADINFNRLEEENVITR